MQTFMDFRGRILDLLLPSQARAPCSLQMERTLQLPPRLGECSESSELPPIPSLLSCQQAPMRAPPYLIYTELQAGLLALLFLLFLLGKYVCMEWGVQGHSACECVCPQRPAEGIRSSGAVVTDSGEPGACSLGQRLGEKKRLNCSWPGGTCLYSSILKKLKPT